jgi:MFS family permease
VTTYWFFRYLETERGYDEGSILVTMGTAVVLLSLGYFIGGAVGDYWFKRSVRGRLLTSMIAVLVGAVLLTVAINVPVEEETLFLVMLNLTALFIPFSSPNVISTVYDITLPEVRSTALAVQYFIENIGAALAPLLAGYIAVRSSLETAILAICVSTWIAGSIILAFAALNAPADIEKLREQLRERAAQERRLQAEVAG